MPIILLKKKMGKGRYFKSQNNTYSNKVAGDEHKLLTVYASIRLGLGMATLLPGSPNPINMCLAFNNLCLLIVINILLTLLS